MSASVPSLAASPARRLVAIDWMRGLVMILMTVDHASDAFNGGRIFGDSALRYHGAVLPAAQFLTRWITHLCAPTFVFLAGAALSLSVARRTARGESAWSIDKHIITRGLFIAAVDPLWMSLGFTGYRIVVFQVMYALGMSLVCMAALRRLPKWALVVAGLVLIVGVDLVVTQRIEAMMQAATQSGTAAPTRASAPLLLGLLVSGGMYLGKLAVAYPLASWLGIMMLGWAFGTHLQSSTSFRPARFLAIAGVLSLAIFVVLRGLDGFGNMALHRTDDSLMQWLHVSKYPPSITYCTLELGLMALLLAAFFALSRRGGAGALTLLRPVGVLGSNALFYYLLHVHLLMLASFALGLHQKLGVGAAYLSTAVAVFVLYFACLRYARYKASHDNFVTRYV